RALGRSRARGAKGAVRCADTGGRHPDAHPGCVRPTRRAPAHGALSLARDGRPRGEPRAGVHRARCHRAVREAHAAAARRPGHRRRPRRHPARVRRDLDHGAGQLVRDRATGNGAAPRRAPDARGLGAVRRSRRDVCLERAEARLMRPACIGLAWLALLTACHGPPDDAITGTGTLEITEVDVSPTSAGHVTRVVVDEGQRVSAGDTLAALTQPTLSGDIDALRARVASAAATLRDLEQGPRPEEITRAAADLESARADAVRTTSDLARLTPLAARNIVSQQQLDAARAANVNAIARREAAAASVRLLRQGTREEQLRAARAELQNARASLAA